MAVIFPWLGVAVLVGGVLAVLAGFLVAKYRKLKPNLGDVRLAFPERFRGLPRYQQLLRKDSLLRRIEVGFLGVCLIGAAWIAARVTSPSLSSEEKSNRDIMLCLDVSGSMVTVDRQLINVYQNLASELSGERIGMVLFDSSSVVVFPLTDDAEYIKEQLADAITRIGPDLPPYPGTGVAEGSSLIGDGMVSCLQRFDNQDQVRSRTLVLATDNQLAGEPLFTIKQATDLAEELHVMIFGVVPSGTNSTDRTNLSAQVTRTDGTVLDLDTSGDTDVDLIRSQIEKQEKYALVTSGRLKFNEWIWPGAVLCAIGLIGAGVSRGLRPEHRSAPRRRRGIRLAGRVRGAGAKRGLASETSASSSHRSALSRRRGSVDTSKPGASAQGRPSRWKGAK